MSARIARNSDKIRLSGLSLIVPLITYVGGNVVISVTVIETASSGLAQPGPAISGRPRRPRRLRSGRVAVQGAAFLPRPRVRRRSPAPARKARELAGRARDRARQRSREP